MPKLQERILTILVWMCLLSYADSIPEVDVFPKNVAGVYGDRVCFTCTTTHEEAHWKVENETIEGITNGHSADGQLVVKLCLNVTRNVTLTCYGETPSRYEDVSGTDIGEVTLISEGPLKSESVVSATADSEVYLQSGNGSVESGNLLLLLHVNITSDFGTPEHFCVEINGVNATVSSSDFRPGDSINQTMIVTLNISSTDVCDYSNVTIKVCAVRDNMSTPFSNLITVHVLNCPLLEDSPPPTMKQFDATVAIVVVVIIAGISVVAAGILVFILWHRKNKEKGSKQLEEGHISDDGNSDHGAVSHKVGNECEQETAPFLVDPPTDDTTPLADVQWVISEDEEEPSEEGKEDNTIIEGERDFSNDSNAASGSTSPKIPAEEQEEKNEAKQTPLQPTFSSELLYRPTRLSEDPTTHCANINERTGADTCSEDTSNSVGMETQDPLSSSSQMVAITHRTTVRQSLTRDDDCLHDKVDDNISPHGCKTPNQSSFPGLSEPKVVSDGALPPSIELLPSSKSPSHTEHQLYGKEREDINGKDKEMGMKEEEEKEGEDEEGVEKKEEESEKEERKGELIQDPSQECVVTLLSVEPTAPKSPPPVQRAPLEEKETSKSLDIRRDHENEPPEKKEKENKAKKGGEATNVLCTPDVFTPPSVEPTAPKSPPPVQRAPLEEKETSKNLDIRRDFISENAVPDQWCHPIQ